MLGRFLYCDCSDYRKRKKCRAGIWFASVVDRLEADLNVSLQLIVRKGLGLSGLNDWRGPAHITRERSDVSLEDPVIVF